MTIGGVGLLNGLYVVNNANNTVSKLDLFDTGAMPPLGGLVNPQALAFDSHGNLYVLNAGDNSTLGFVSKFFAGNVNDGNGGNNYTVTTVNNTTGVINKAPLTITAQPNTKTYDATPTAAVKPAVSGLIGSDNVTNLTEAYAGPNVGTGKSLSVSAYTVTDGNSGNNYSVTLVNNAAGVINPGPFSKFVDTILGGNTITAGTHFIFTVQAVDSYGNPVSSYSGPTSVTTTPGQADPLSEFPVSGTLAATDLASALGL